MKTDRRRACPLRVRGMEGTALALPVPPAHVPPTRVSAKHVSYAVLPPVRSAECNASGVFVT